MGRQKTKQGFVAHVWLAPILSTLLVEACGNSAAPEICDDPPSYAQDIGPSIVASRCVQCHSTDRHGDARHGAPTELNFDSYELVRSNEAAFANAITSGLMPPIDLDPPLATTKEERELVIRWARCDYLP